MKISAIRKPEEEEMGSESDDSEPLEQLQKKKARKNKRSSNSTLLIVGGSNNGGGGKHCSSDEEESECDDRENVLLNNKNINSKKRFSKAKVLSSPPPITLTLKKTCDSTFLGESSSSNVHDNNSYLSSSDNELPALVNAAIKCVESDSESNSETTPSKMTQQYTSSLLQDYMEKTQLLAQEPSPPNKDKKLKDVVKRKRGRPRKNTSLVLETDSGKILGI